MGASSSPLGPEGHLLLSAHLSPAPPGPAFLCLPGTCRVFLALLVRPLPQPLPLEGTSSSSDLGNHIPGITETGMCPSLCATFG